ncbi:hypothetical protein [Nocardioides sp.]|uniref:hypothetical protein n=1 Tax=Nocardioides sp. TaxID=35761 RepID=UPI003529A8C5
MGFPSASSALEPEATLAAEAGGVAFRVGFARWLEGPADEGLPAMLLDSHRRLAALAPSGGSGTTRDGSPRARRRTPAG